VAEVVPEEDLYRVRIMTELCGDARSTSGYLSDLLGLFLLELHLKSCHVYHPIHAVAPRCALSLSKTLQTCCAATFDTSPSFVIARAMPTLAISGKLA
jgi:hypothetical protein